MGEQNQTTTTTKSPVTIRPAVPSDAEAIAQLGAHVFTATFGHSVEPHELDAYLAQDYSLSAIKSDLADASKTIIVAVDDDDHDDDDAPSSRARLLGFAYLTRGTGEPCVAHLEAAVELQRLYVHTDAHGRGVGGALARRLEQVAREQGFRHVWLGVWEENAVAQRAYARWGYGRVGAHDFVVGSVVQTDWILVKEL